MANETIKVPQAEDHSGIIEVDERDVESGYETCKDGISETTSLSSSLQEYIVENGRRYHAYYGPDKNLMPTDEVEQERLDVHHEIMLLITEKRLHHAPVAKSSHRVLDIGTGTGIWAIDYAYEHPEAEVIGMDLSPIQPNWVPPNCRFEVDDFELNWTYEKGSFDFIHARNICHSVQEWPNVLSQVMSHLKPGAWFELGELGSEMCSDDHSIPDDWPPDQAWRLGREALSKLGRIVPTASWLKTLLIDAGFEAVQVKTFKHPLGTWPKHKDLKQAGGLYAITSDTAYHAYMMSLLTRVLGWSSEDADALCKAAHAAHMNKRSGVHAYSYFHVVYGKKPKDGKADSPASPGKNTSK